MHAYWRAASEELEQLLRGYGYTPYFVEGHEPEPMHQLMAATLDQVIAEIKRIQSDARERGVTERPRGPMIVLKTPKGWTGRKVVDGLPVEGTYRAHQVPLSEPTEHRFRRVEITVGGNGGPPSLSSLNERVES